MAVTGLEAARAYLAAANAAKSQSTSPTEGPGFGEVLNQALQSVVGSAKGADAAAASAVAGKGDLIDVVTAVAAAQASLQTVVAVRDQVINAYQEILRLPI